MIERAIENWLINTNERSYQLPFCHVLMKEGHSILHVSSHRSLEQGKDIITVDHDGHYCGYQLKTGKIDIPVWRRIREEVKELMELPIVHPSVDKSIVHKSFLVTNGEVTDEVRIQIDQMNDDNVRKNRCYSHLDVIGGRSLLKSFIDAQGEFMPAELEDFRLFLEMFLADGQDLFPTEEYFRFIGHTVFGRVPAKTREQLNAINSSVIITAYLLSPFQRSENYFAQFEAWTSLARCMVRFATVCGLETRKWKTSYDLVMSEIVADLNLLLNEAHGRENFLEGDWLGDGRFMYRARITLVVGALAALDLHLQSRSKDFEPGQQVLNIIRPNLHLLWFWGESAFPYWFSVIKLLEISGHKSTSLSILKILTRLLIHFNSPEEEKGLASPYYGVHDLLEHTLGISLGAIDFRQFSGASHVLEILVYMLARRQEREFLEEHWEAISHFRLRRFRPGRKEDIFAWHTGDGLNQSRSFDAPQSWANLCAQASSRDGVNELIEEFTELLRFFILVVPHRATLDIITALDH